MPAGAQNLGVRIRQEKRDDARAVRAVHADAFGGAGPTVARLTDDLRRTTPARQRLSLVAVKEERIVGHVLFSRALLDAPAQLVPVRVLSPVGVRSGHQGRGIGSALIRRGLELVAERAVPAVFLEGDPDYYSRFGFIPAGELGFRKPSLRIPDAAFQVLRLPSYESSMTGTLVYPEAFWRNDSVGLRDS